MENGEKTSTAKNGYLAKSTSNKLATTLVFTTGGTIEKTYDESDGSLTNRGSVVEKQILPLLRLPYKRLVVHGLMSKDSLFMEDSDRAFICDALAAHAEEARPMLVLHGTDTMAVTARFCFERLQEVLQAPVIFTGAMKPFGFHDSDALQNVTEALMASTMCPPGVYIAFHGRLFSADKARKNLKRKTFEYDDSDEMA